MKRKLIVAAIIIAVLLLLVIASLAGKSGGSYSASQKSVVPQTFLAAVNYADNTVLTTNGSSFITYNVVTGKVTLLSPAATDNSLLSIDSISLSDNRQYVVFHSVITTPGSLLATALASSGQTNGDDRWWVYSVSAKTFRTLPATTVIAKTSGNTVSALLSTESDQQVVSYDAASLRANRTTSVPRSNNFVVTSDGIVLQNNANQLLLTSDGVVSKTIASDTTLVGSDPTHHSIIAVSGQPASSSEATADSSPSATPVATPSKLVSINLQSGKTTTVSESISGQAVLSGGAVLFTQTGATFDGISKAGVYNVATAKLTSWNLNKTQDSAKDIQYKPVVWLGKTAAVFSATEDMTYLLGSGFKQLKSTENYAATVDITPVPASSVAQISIDYEAGQRSFLISTPTNAASEIEAGYARLRNDGFDTNLYPIYIVPAESD